MREPLSITARERLGVCSGPKRRPITAHMSRGTVLILGNYRQTVSVVRSLSPAGYNTLVGATRKRVITRYSRFTDEIWLHPPLEEEPAAFIDALADLLARRSDVGWVFPVGEDEIRLMIGHWSALRAPQRVVMPDPSIAEVCLLKPRLYEVSRECDVPFAEFGVARDARELEEWVASIGYPMVIKPCASVGQIDGHNALILESEAERQRMLPRWPAHLDSLIVQRYARGLRHNCHFVADQGRLLAYFEQRVERTNRHDRTMFAVESVSVPPTPLLRGYTDRLAVRLGYSGAGCAQFLVEDGEHVHLLELNPRLDANCEMARRCGQDMPRLAVEVQQHRCGELPSAPAGKTEYLYRRCQWLLGDVLGLLHEICEGDIGAGEALTWARLTALALIRADFHLVGWLRDPLPELFRLGQSMLVPLSRLRKRLSRQ